MPYRRFKILHLILAVLIIAVTLAVMIEQESVIGQSSTRSPDGNWSLNLKLIEHSTLFTSRRILDANIAHKTNTEWNVSTSIPLNEADAKTIGNELPDHPIGWSDDSSTVSYWIHKGLKDSIKIEASDEQFSFQRDLYSTSVTYTPRPDGG